MTIQEALTRTDRMKPNQLTAEEKIRMLSKLDQMIWNEIFTNYLVGWEPGQETQPDGYWPSPFDPPGIHERPQPAPTDVPLVEKPSYDGDTDTDTELLVESPYDEIYPFYLAAQIDLFNQEFDLYSNNKELYNNHYQTYVDYVHRTYPPRKRKTRWRL